MEGNGIVYRGDVSVKEQPGSGETELGGQITLRFKGRDDASFDSTVDDAIPSTHYVVSRRKTPLKGGLAECVVVLKPKSGGGGGGEEPAGTLDVTWEVEMAQLEKPLLSHPDYSGYADVVDKWRQSPAEIRNQDKYVTGTDDGGEYTTADLSSSELAVVAKIRKGVESYLVFAPVATKTSLCAAMPAVGADCGKRCAPTVAPAGDWAWLKTGDRAVQREDRTWQRVEVWTGADEWDEDLYEAG